jgi:hypothetical protein
MKILILSALKEWIIRKFSPDKWKEVAEETGLGEEQFTQQAHYLSDDRFNMVVAKVCKILNLDQNQLNNEFTEYWMTDFAPRIYNYLIKKSSTIKDFVLGIFKLTNDVCKLFPNKNLTKVDFSETDHNSVTAIYPSEKVLVDIVAVLRGAAMFFPDKFNIRKINPHSVEIMFIKTEPVE